MGELIPTSYNITQYNQLISVDTGENTLLIKGVGGIEVYGLTVDNVRLVRQGSTDNIIENGNFEDMGISGWNSIIHDAPLFNHMWAKTKVGRVDANINQTLVKVFHFDSYFRLKTNKMNLLVDYAAKKGVSLSAVRGTCTWNHHIEKFEPKDYEIQQVKIPVEAHEGENMLKFEGEGLIIDNVRLIPLGSVSNILLNGDFEIPTVNDQIGHTVPSGWNGDNTIEFGTGYLFTEKWGHGSNQVVSLTRRNHELSQIVSVDHSKTNIRPEFPFFGLSLDFVAADDGEELVGEVFWNHQLVGSLKDLKDMNHFTARVDARYGINTLTIKRKNQGAAIGNVRLVRYGLDENIVENGDFQATVHGGKIPAWKGKAVLDNSEDYL